MRRHVGAWPSSIALFLALTAGAGCGDAREGEPPQRGVRTWRVAGEPAVRIGGEDEREGYLLERVADATRLSDGRIVVADGGSSELLVYDDAGVHVATTGGEGEGPGELVGIMQLDRLPGDTLRVFSFRPGLTWYSPEVDYVRSQPVDVWGIAPVPCRLGESNWHVLPDGSFLTVLMDNFGIPNCPPSPETPWRQSALMARSDPGSSSALDTLAILPGTERNSPNYRVYGRDLVIAIASDRVYAADTGADSVLAVSFDGDTLAVLPVPFEPRPVPPEAKRETVRRWTDREGQERVGNAYDYPETYPAVGRVLTDEEGMLWIMRYPELTEPTSSWRVARSFSFLVDPEGAEWAVLDPDGQLVAELRTPPGLFPLEIGTDYVLGLEKDELDRQSVVMYGLAR